MNIKETTQKLTEKLIDSGKIIQGGWAGFRLATIPIQASETQVIEMRKAFFAEGVDFKDRFCEPNLLERLLLPLLPTKFHVAWPTAEMTEYKQIGKRIFRTR